MIGIDTNVLVRYFVHDDAKQTARASDFIERHLTPSLQGYVTVVALTEMVWVLSRTYRFSDEQVVLVIQQLLGTDNVVVENKQEVFNAMYALEHDHGDFADALIAELGARAGCTHTVTFDLQALRLASFRPVP